MIADGEAVVAVLVAQAARGDGLALGISLAPVLCALLGGGESRVVCGPLGVLHPVALAGAARVLGAARMLGAELGGRRAALPNLSTYQLKFPYPYPYPFPRGFGHGAVRVHGSGRVLAPFGHGAVRVLARFRHGVIGVRVRRVNLIGDLGRLGLAQAT
ncbi:Uncharacterised protein [Mycobacteroides abscessus subsp. abscessus]|nr:Uncharacterised protein [Mycobacteroides abscessus subsp. abscessus]